MNRNYRRGRQKEYQLKDRFENEGYVVFRTAGSHGIADLILIKPNTEIGEADLCPEIRFIQVKSGIHVREIKKETRFINHLQVEFFYLPTKTKEWYADRKNRRNKRMAKKASKKS